MPRRIAALERVVSAHRESRGLDQTQRAILDSRNTGELQIADWAFLVMEQWLRRGGDPGFLATDDHDLLTQTLACALSYLRSPPEVRGLAVQRWSSP
jgi:hypothetical protein